MSERSRVRKLKEERKNNKIYFLNRMTQIVSLGVDLNLSDHLSDVFLMAGHFFCLCVIWWNTTKYVPETSLTCP